MYSALTLTLKYVAYLFGSSNGKGHGIHSPFVFEFVQKVLNDKTKYSEYAEVDRVRRKLLSDNTPVPLEDYGAGSRALPSSRSISEIVRHSAKSAKYGALLFRIVKFYRPHYVLELGTSLGISTAYLALADNTAVVVTGEGNYAVASHARENLETLRLTNVRIITGNFDNTLPEMVSAIPHVDLAFIDANHRKKPTIGYFNELLKKVTSNSIVIFDDIHWSRGMEQAWREIKGHPSVMLTIDIFFFGIIFFRPEFKVKQHFTIRF
jgi:predicted O-methyltransferase YrrM